LPHICLYLHKVAVFKNKIYEVQDGFTNQHQWLMLVILATQEAEIRRIVFESLPRQIVHKTLS
jgi:hypothetical protein